MQMVLPALYQMMLPACTEAADVTLESGNRETRGQLDKQRLLRTVSWGDANGAIDVYF